MQTKPVHKLFSYGTLRYKQVQLDTFGRELEGRPDALLGYKLDQVEITDPDVLASSGEKYHPIVRHTGNDLDSVAGAVLLISADELAQADGYEVDDYIRKEAPLASGEKAWVYVSKEE